MSNAPVTYVVPGVLLLCAGFGASLTAVSVSHDMTGGIIDRFRSLDVGGTELLAGHVVASVVRNAISTALVFSVAFAIGFRPDASALDWLAIAGIMVLYITTMSWFAVAIGLIAKSPEAASGFTFLVMFLPYASSAFVPIDSMPGWIQHFARHQPVTPITETLRALLLNGDAGAHAGAALLWCGGLLLASIAISTRLFCRRTG